VEVNMKTILSVLVSIFLTVMPVVAEEGGGMI
jgi:hypothetical protein